MLLLPVVMSLLLILLLLPRLTLLLPLLAPFGDTVPAPGHAAAPPGATTTTPRNAALVMINFFLEQDPTARGGIDDVHHWATFLFRLPYDHG